LAGDLKAMYNYLKAYGEKKFGTAFWRGAVKEVNILDDIFDLQKSVVNANKNTIANAANNAKGAFGEIASDAFLTEKGFKPLHTRKTALTQGWGETGIDGVFVKDGQYYIVEAKYRGQATLTPANSATNLPKQMSDNWIQSGDRLLKAVGNDHLLVDQILKDYKRILAESAPDGTVTYKLLDANANIIGVFTP
jgi:Holliday junction resolvase-like predicted endonuclease